MSKTRKKQSTADFIHQKSTDTQGADVIKWINYRPTQEMSDIIRTLMRPSDKNQPTRFLDRLIGDRFHEEIGKQ